MPIYAYRCDSCGVEKDVLQKLSDAPLTVCPGCGASAFHKRLSAPAFQLKGSGWYVTDFRDGARKPDGGKAADDGKTAEGGKATEGGKAAEGGAAPPAGVPAGGADASSRPKGGEAAPASTSAAAPAPAASGTTGSA